MLFASLLILAALGCYAVLCAVRPFADCRKCDGIGHQLRQDRKGKTKLGKVCRRCRGKRQRLRIGRRISNAWIRTRDAGAR
ncbi:hypothetical protein [Streptomyces sp. NPDC005283]|uniref:hypothetical protein n=1 Tax=Streptomyces sp. NPDC005283 TaxID=3156871 RepID=UPI003456DF8A